MQSQMQPQRQNTPFLRVQKLSPSAQLPTKGSPDSAGWDLKAAHETIVPARGKAIIATDLSIAVPDGCYGRIAPRSGLSWKKHTDIGAGVIDMDYRGPVGVVIFNHADTDLKIEVGDRVAQLILEKISYAEMVEVVVLDNTQRGEGGFGSTGK
jgi:dUTP pyrophosphatase